MLIAEQIVITGDEWLEVEYTYYMKIYNIPGTKKIRDVFNYEKCLSDLLATGIEWFQDHKIKIGRVEKVESDRDEVEIKIKEVKS